MPTTLERQVREEWRRWAEYRQFGICGCCGESLYVGRHTRRRRWLCLGCFDQGER